MNVKNRKCIRKLSWRSLWASRKRNIIAIIAIALTALLFTSLFTIVMSINSSYEMYTFRQVGGYCHGTFKEVTEEQIKNISAHSNVKAAGKRITIGYMNSGIFAKLQPKLASWTTTVLNGVSQNPLQDMPHKEERKSPWTPML